MKCFLSKYSVYTSYIAALSEDPTVKSADKAKLKDQWEAFLFVPFFHKVMQSFDVYILSAVL